MEFVIEEVLSLSNRPITASLMNKQFNSNLNEKFEFIPKHKLQIRRLTFEIDSINRHKYNRIALGKSSDTIYHQIGFKAYSVALFPSLMDYYIKKGAVILLISIALVLLIGTILVFQYRNINRERKFADFIVDYTRMMTHDLRTPVSGIQMIFKMFHKNKASQEGMQEKYLVEGENLTKKILLNLDNILFMAKSEQMKLPVHLTEVGIRNFMEKTVEMYRMRDYNPKTVRIETHYEPDDFNCRMDVSLMENVFCNLLDNAIKFTPQDALIVVNCSKVGKNVIFSIRDNGTGMSTEDQKHIFELFERGSANKNSQFPGFGIGLHFVERAVKAHGGKVTVQSELGKGSEFTIRYTSTAVS
jgi:signal transduction histidine kinase